MLHSFDHVIVAVSDLERATQSYSTLLGLAPSWRGRHAEYGTANSLFRLANGYVELLSPAGGGPVGAQVRAAIEENGEGMLGIVFGTDDADAFARVARERGLDVGDPQPGVGHNDDSDAVRRWRNAVLHPKSSRGLLMFAIEHQSPEDALPMAEPTGDANACVRALDHVVVASPDIEASGALYGDALGLRLALDRSFEQRGLRMLFFRIGGVTVEVVGRLGDAPDAAAPDRFGGIAYRVADADAIHGRLTAAGFDLTEVREGNKPGTTVCTVRDGTCGVPTLLIS
jgi:catechol 2,3-dioxygenase-like lactoylglutathione lyase family enzyme